MKLLVLGATGGIGRELVAQALARGDAVTALVRNPSKLEIRDARLRVLEGSPLDRASVARALEGAHAVLSTLGHTGLGPSSVVTDGARVLASAMSDSGVRRLAIVSTTLVLAGGGMLARLPKWLTRHAVSDSSAMESLLRATELAWTSLRLVRLTNGPVAPYRTFEGPATVFEHLSRKSAAACLLDCVGNEALARRAVGVAAQTGTVMRKATPPSLPS